MSRKPPYIACLIRLWQVRHAGVWVWRASLEDPHTGEQMGFADIESLFAHLKKQTEEQARDEENGDQEWNT